MLLIHEYYSHYSKSCDSPETQRFIQKTDSVWNQSMSPETNRDFDSLVYELCGLSDKEIQIIEDSMKIAHKMI
ncbi:MAG TPA: hypothetical protein PKV16_04270 [Caldisericia bacterium]|nr:hypothetical protein [Caldisericia bacterium]HPF48524.1 hypothetical protein [Caldisericia bacterium]HPI84606.1 hypothetical protein [Caldisericia bacterium]HPQ92979.1 hypothetical protein [Caldisericia bacterium]HRV75187.1 hypothetical protein [Caldisericia bacterium]